MSPSGKTAHVTAAAQDGAAVIATDINRDALTNLSSASVQITVEQLDVLADAVASALVAQAASADVLVNCARRTQNGTILGFTEMDWDRSFDLNVKAMTLLTKKAFPGMLVRGGWSI